MIVTRDVVLDLLPLYLAQELSPDSRALVEAFLAQDPQLARLARLGAPLASTPALPPVDDRLHRDALARTRRLLRRRQVWIGAAVAMTLLPLSFGFAEGRIVWAMWRDAPGLASTFAVGAILCWAAVVRDGAKLRAPGL